MGTVVSILAKSVLGHSDAENAFRPWWKTVQDHLIYGLIATGDLCIFRNIYSNFDIDNNFKKMKTNLTFFSNQNFRSHCISKGNDQYLSNLVYRMC